MLPSVLCPTLSSSSEPSVPRTPSPLSLLFSALPFSFRLFYSLLFPSLPFCSPLFVSFRRRMARRRPDPAACQSERDRPVAWSKEDGAFSSLSLSLPLSVTPPASPISLARSVSRFYVYTRGTAEAEEARERERETDKRMVLILKPLAPHPIPASTPSNYTDEPQSCVQSLFLPLSSRFRHLPLLDSAR